VTIRTEHPHLNEFAAGQRQGQEPSADMRLDGDQVTRDPGDGDAGDVSNVHSRRQSDG